MFMATHYFFQDILIFKTPIFVEFLLNFLPKTLIAVSMATDKQIEKISMDS